MVTAQARVGVWRFALAAAGGMALPATPAWTKEGVSDCDGKACIVMEAAPSFSNVSIKARRDVTGPDSQGGTTTRKVADFVLMQPFKQTPYGPPVGSMGLGSVRSAQARLTVTRVKTFDPDVPVEETSNPVVSAQLLAALSHRRMVSDTVVGQHHVDRFGYALGLGLSYRADDRTSFAGRLKWGGSLQYRRQYLPDATNDRPVRVHNLIVGGSVAGGIAGVPLFRNGIGFDLSGAYDIDRKVPGVKLGLATQVIEHPSIVLGVDAWVQGRDNDQRTRDKRWDWAPRLSLQF